MAGKQGTLKDSARVAELGKAALRVVNPPTGVKLTAKQKFYWNALVTGKPEWTLPEMILLVRLCELHEIYASQLADLRGDPTKAGYSLLGRRSYDIWKQIRELTTSLKLTTAIERERASNEARAMARVAIPAQELNGHKSDIGNLFAMN